MKYTPPRIGEYWPEKAGIYCGTIARAGEPEDGYLILHPTPKKDCPLVAAHDYAGNMTTGNNLWWLPSIEQLMLMRTNCPKLIGSGSYWSSNEGRYKHSAFCMDVQNIVVAGVSGIKFIDYFADHDGIACAVYVAPIISGD